MMVVCGNNKCKKPMPTGSSRTAIYKWKTSTVQTIMCEECFAKAKPWQKAKLPPRYHSTMGYFKGDTPKPTKKRNGVDTI